MPNVGGIAGDHLKSLIERIERLEEEKRALSEDIREIYAEAKGTGFDPKIMRQLIRERKRDKDDLDEEATLLDIYKRAIGMLADTPLGKAALKEKFGEEAVAPPDPVPTEPPKPKPAAAKSKPVVPTRNVAMELGETAAWAGRAASTNPYPAATADRDDWHKSWITAWNERGGKEPGPDRSKAIAYSLGRESSTSLVIDCPFRSGTPEAVAWEEGWGEDGASKMPEAADALAEA